MSLEFIALTSCAVNESLDPGEFHRRLKMYRQCRGMSRIFKDQGMSREQMLAAPIQFHTVAQGQPARKDASIRFGEMLEQVKPFVATGRAHCPQCPLGADGIEPVFGCYGAVNYPISAQGEQWFMDRFALHGGDDSFVLHLLRENKITGKRVRAGRPGGLLRKRPAMLLERPKPYIVKVGGRGGPEVSADQILELIFGIGTWSFHVMLHFLKDFGAVDTLLAEEASKDLALEMVAALAGAGGSGKPPLPPSTGNLGPFLLATPEPGEDVTIAQFRNFFHVMYKAYNQRIPLSTDG